MEPKTGFQLVAPVGALGQPAPWEGRAARKPWEYRVSVCIPHLNTPEPLPVIIDLLRLQTERPYIHIIDTGSSPDSRGPLEALRAEDVEISYVFCHAWRHGSEPVCAALNLAHDLCKTEYLFHTHSDVFLRRKDFLASLVQRCNASNPVVGYELSERSWVTDEWKGMVSHTATMVHNHTVYIKHRINWSYQRVHYGYGYPWTMGAGWPDTETGFNRTLKEVGITPDFIGHDKNYEPQVDDNIHHVRSYGGSKLYGQAYYARAAEWMATALDEARQRADVWRAGGG